MQCRKDHLERRLAREAGMGIDRNPSAVVSDGDPIASTELDLDPSRISGNRFVHGIIEDLCGQVMQPALIRGSDIHAGAAANGLQPLENLDVLGGVAVDGLGRGCVEKIRHGANIWRVGAGASSIQYEAILWPPDVGRLFDASGFLLRLAVWSEGTLAYAGSLRL